MQNNTALKTFVIDLIKNNIPSTYYYHQEDHTLYVLEKAIEIGNHEKCTAKEIDLLQAAALLHDTGFISTYHEHEEESCRLATIYLPDYGYSATSIKKICGMIMATKLPQSPKNKLEEILVDADLEYLGTDLAVEQAEKLYREMHSLQPTLTIAQWNLIQISFLEQHHYFTPYCKKYKEAQKKSYLLQLTKL
ncbi:MAG: HD domain-containing protein [Chitinophagaceae bacterium]